MSSDIDWVVHSRTGGAVDAFDDLDACLKSKAGMWWLGFPDMSSTTQMGQVACVVVVMESGETGV